MREIAGQLLYLEDRKICKHAYYIAFRYRPPRRMRLERQIPNANGKDGSRPQVRTRFLEGFLNDERQGIEDNYDRFGGGISFIRFTSGAAVTVFGFG